MFIGGISTIRHGLGRARPIRAPVDLSGAGCGHSAMPRCENDHRNSGFPMKNGVFQ